MLSSYLKKSPNLSFPSLTLPHSVPSQFEMWYKKKITLLCSQVLRVRVLIRVQPGKDWGLESSGISSSMSVWCLRWDHLQAGLDCSCQPDCIRAVLPYDLGFHTAWQLSPRGSTWE